MTLDDNYAQAMIEFAIPKYRSKIEEEYATLGEILVHEWLGVRVLLTHYEPLIFQLPGAFSYKGDFMHVLEDRRILFVEVKNSKKQKGYRITHNKILTAAAIHPYFMWAECIKDKGWAFEEIGK
jgi:hypothetical protein